MMTDEFQTTLQRWLQEDGEALIDIFLHHSGGGGELYLLKSPDQAEAAIQLAISNATRYGDGEATITAFRSGYYPLRGSVDKAFVEKMRLAWPRKGWYSIVNLEHIFPKALGSVGSGDTQQELEDDLEELLADWQGIFVGFGENPFDTDANEWAVRNQVDVIETTVGEFNWGRHTQN